MATKYVATTGSNGAAGDIGTPWQTINFGVTQIGAGDTLLVRGGDYNETLHNPSMAAGTSWSNKIRIAAYPSETVWMRPTSGEYVASFWGDQRYVEFDGINMDATQGVLNGAFKAEEGIGYGTDHMRLQNAEILYGGNTGLSYMNGIAALGLNIDGVGHNEFINLNVHATGSILYEYPFYISSNDNLIEGCDIHASRVLGVHLYNGYGYPPKRTIVKNNRIHDIVLSDGTNRIWGIIDVGINSEIYNNLIYNNGMGSIGDGILTYGSNSGSRIYNNTVYGNLGGGIVVGTSGAIVRNNIIYLNAGGNYVDNGSGTIADHNLTGNPLFTDAPNGDFTLLPGSPAIDTGITIPTVLTDFSGATRPFGAYDIGAFEFGSSVPPVPPQPPIPPPAVIVPPGGGGGGVKQFFCARSFIAATNDGASPGFSSPCCAGLVSWQATEGLGDHPWSVAGTFIFLHIRLSVAPSTSRTYAVRINGVDTGLSVTISGSATTGSLAVNVAVAAGDIVSLHRTHTGSPAGTETDWWLEFVSESWYDSCHAWNTYSTPPNFNILTTYLSPFNADPLFWNTTINNYRSLVGVAGAVTRFDIRLSAAPGGAASYTFDILVNGAPASGSSVTISGASTTGTWTGSVAVTPGQRVEMRCVPSGTPVAAKAAGSLQFTATTAHEFNVAGGSNEAPSTTVTGYQDMKGTWAWTATETARTILASGSTFRLVQLYVQLSADPGLAKGYTYSLRQNGANPSGGPSVTITGDGTTPGILSGSDVVNSALVAPGNTLDMQSVPFGSPLTRNGYWVFGAIATTATTGVTLPLPPPPPPPGTPIPCTPQTGNGGSGQAGCNGGGVGWTHCYTGAYGTVPQHTDPTIGLGTEDIWVDLVHPDYPSGTPTTYRRAFQEIADPSTYHGGRKQAGLLSIGDIEHGLSNEQGSFEAATVTLEFSDTDRFWRTLLDTQDLEGDELRVYISDKARRETALPSRVLQRASVQTSPTQSPLRTSLVAVDALFSDTGPFGPNRTFPDRKVPAGVWLNTPPESLELYLPSLWGVKSDEGAVHPITNVLSEKGLIPLIYVGQQVIGSNVSSLVPPTLLPQNYSIVRPNGAFATDFIGGGTMSGRVWAYVTAVNTAGEESLVSNLAGTIEYNRALIVNWSASVGPNISYYRVYWFTSAPSGFAEFTPTTWQTTPQARFVTHDTTTFDGNSGADYSVTITDFTMGTDYLAGLTTVSTANIWDVYLATLGCMFKVCSLFGSDLGNGSSQNPPERVKMDLTTRAGTEFLVPGFAGWPYATNYVPYTAPDGTVYWLTMIFAKGPVSDDHKAGVINMTINGYGYETVGDGTGLPIMGAFQCEQHWLENFVYQRYTSGVWVTTSTAPKWEDGTPKVKSSTFAAAQTFTIQQVGGVGLTAGWYISRPVATTMLASAWNRETESSLGINAQGQAIVWYLDPMASTTTWPQIRHVTDLFGPVIRTPGQERENVIVGVCDWDPDVQAFRSATLTAESLSGIAKFKGRRKQGAVIESTILNVESHLQSVLLRRLLRLRFGETVSDITGKIDLLDHDVTQGILLTTIEGTGATGDVSKPYVIRRRRTRLQSRLVTYSLMDMTGIVIPLAQQFIIGPNTFLGPGGFTIAP